MSDGFEEQRMARNYGPVTWESSCFYWKDFTPARRERDQRLLRAVVEYLGGCCQFQNTKHGYKELVELPVLTQAQFGELQEVRDILCGLEWAYQDPQFGCMLVESARLKPNAEILKWRQERSKMADNRDYV